MKGVEIKTYTWTKDSNKLFDYECSNLSQNNIITTDNIVITRKENQIIFHDMHKGDPPSGTTPLCCLKRTQDGQFFLSSADLATPLKLVIRSLNSKGKQKGYELRVGDKMQIGRVEYIVREMKNDQENTIKADHGSLDLKKDMEIEDEPIENKVCRICFEEENKDDKDTESVFITPCLCKGTSKYVHLGCLKNWIKSKKQPIKTHSRQGHHGLHSSLINLLNNLVGLSSQPIPLPFPPYWNFNQSNPSDGLSNHSIRSLNPFNATFNPRLNSINMATFGNAAPETESNPSFTSGSTATPLNTLLQQFDSLDSILLNSANQTPNNNSDNQQNPAPKPKPSGNVENTWFSNFACDVCKEVLPFIVKLENQSETETANISRPENTPYVILERLSQGKGPKGFSVIKGVEGNEIFLGRGHLCDVAISDISVSRWHAVILYQHGKFVIIDNNSKYGTLVKLEEPIEIKDEKLEFQSGRTLITVSTKTLEELITPEHESLEMTEAAKGRKSKRQISKSKMSSTAKKCSLGKQMAAQVKTPSKKKSKNIEAENDSTSDVEEISPNEFPELNKRSKKIGKNVRKNASFANK